MKVVLYFLVVLVVAYVAMLSLLLGVNENRERVRYHENAEPHQNGRLVEHKNAINFTTTQLKNVVQDDDRLTIGIASTVTGCGLAPFADGAAVMKYSLEKHSRSAKSKFKYKTYILYHPDAEECVYPLEDLGFTLLERPTPIRVEEIEGDVLRERIVNNGCCGEKELIKLEAFRLTEHPIIVHLDLDVIINKPLDDVLDFMINPEPYKKSPELLAKIPIMWPEKDIPDDISLIFTKDYNVVAPKRSDKPYQGGFFAIKPSLDTYNEYLGIVRKGDYDVKKGWGGKVGPFYGGMTIQGLLPWYYEYLHPGKSVELNRCKYNNMSDKPYLQRKNGERICRTNEEECDDCRFANMEDVVTFHFTICQKPWLCLPYNNLRNKNFQLCRQMNYKWYALRSELEASWGRNGRGTGHFKYDHYKGFCSRGMEGGYQPIRKPYGKTI